MYKGGFLVLLGKGYRFLLMVLAVPVVLLVRALRPFVVIRFGRLCTRRIGDFLINADLYLCERDAGLHNPRTFDIFYYYLPISNYQVKRMLERTGKLHVLPFHGFARALDRVNRLLPGARPHMLIPSYRDVHGLLQRTKSHLSFTPEEERLGREGLRKLGIPDGADFVCFHIRDSAYLETKFPEYCWRYQDFRDAKIHSLIPAAEELVRRGYFMVRMGAVVKEALNTKNLRIIDYATRHRTDFMDIYLGSKCRFFICDTAGIVTIPMVFRRPIAWINYFPFEHLLTGGVQDVLLCGKFWLRKERRFLRLREIMELGLGNTFETEKFEQLGVKVVPNAPDEIVALAVEMDERIKGRWQPGREDEELQRRFWEIVKPKNLNQLAVISFGAEFLRQNHEFLQ